MRRILALSLSFLFLGPLSALALVPAEQRTLFHEAESAWAVGTFRLGGPMEFRDGQIVAFPSQIIDLLWAPDGAKPRNLMLVHELAGDEKEKPFLQKGDEIFALIKLLPEHSYWKDNLPSTRRHAVVGGRRYVFRGEQIPAVRAILDAYLQAFQSKGRSRWTGEIHAVFSALGSTIPVVREDAVRYLVIYPTLARDFEGSKMPLVDAYLKGDAPAPEKAQLVHTLIAAKLSGLQPVLGAMAVRQDASGAVALAGLAELGEVPPVSELVKLSQSPSVEVQSFAAGQLARQVGVSDEAHKRVSEILGDDKASLAVQAAAIGGLAAASDDAAVDLLGSQLQLGGTNCRIAGEALGRVAGEKASSILILTLKEKDGEAAIAAAMGLKRNTSCAECRATLLAQYKAHKDESVREFIGVLLEVPLEHKH